jgi:hypothetical protein
MPNLDAVIPRSLKAALVRDAPRNAMAAEGEAFTATLARSTISKSFSAPALLSLRQKSKHQRPGPGLEHGRRDRQIA